MTIYDKQGRRIRPFATTETAAWLEGIRPNIAATLTVMKARRIHAGSSSYWVRGNELEYGWAYEKLVHDLSGKFLGRAYRRFGKLVPNFACLEGDGENKRHHIHASFRCPDHIEQRAFMQSVEFHWKCMNPWALNDIKIEPIAGGWVGYSSKDGSEALLLNGISF